MDFFYTNPANNVNYHIVRGCVPLSVPVKECGKKETHLLVTVA